MNRIVQIGINAVALYVAERIVPNLEFSGEWWKLIVVAVIFSVVNTYLRPILRILTLPLTLITFGIFLVVINALMLLLTGALSDALSLGFTVGDFGAALLGAIVIAIVGFALSLFVGSSRMAGRVF